MTSLQIDSLLLTLESTTRFLLTWSWQALLLVCLAWLLCRFDRSQQASVRHQVWLFGLAAVVIIPLLSFVGGWLPAEARHNELMARIAALPDRIAPAPMIPLTETFVDSSTNAPGEVAVRASWVLLAYSALCVLWLGGVFVSLLKMVSHQRRIKMMCSRARPIIYADIGLDELDAARPLPVSLRLSAEVSSPMLVGLWHPVILLPERIAEWTSVAERQAIIRHELAHLRRLDSHVLVFQSLLGAIFFFHPAVRYALRQLSVEREMACDEAVVGSGVNAALYADTLLKIAERTLSPRYGFEAISFASKKSLERRIDEIMKASSWSPQRRRLFVAPPLILLCATLWFIGSARAVQMSREEGEVREFLRQVAEDEMRRDPATFDRLSAPEFIRIGADGEVWNKEQTQAYARVPRNQVVRSVEMQDEKIRIYGDTAIVTGLGIARVRDAAGRDSVVRNLCTFVLVKRDGRWLCVSVQQTRQP